MCYFIFPLLYNSERKLIKSVPTFVPAGQSTQMVIGATPESDREILQTADRFYKDFSLKRVYYSGYIPINDNTGMLPLIGTPPPIVRENRLYQTDWLMRFYGFSVDEIVNEAHPDLELDIDPKLSWALRHTHLFPVDINTADYKVILRVPGIGVRSAQKIVAARRFGKLHIYQLKKMGIAYNRAQHFIRCADSPFSLREKDAATIRSLILQEGSSKWMPAPTAQLSLF